MAVAGGRTLTVALRWPGGPARCLAAAGPAGKTLPVAASSRHHRILYGSSRRRRQVHRHTLGALAAVGDPGADGIPAAEAVSAEAGTSETIQGGSVTSAAATEAAATATGLKVAHGEAETPAAPAAAAEADPDGTAHEDSEGPPHWAEWKLGVALAGASFEAYGGLSEPGLPDRTLTGAEIRYTDR